MRVVCVGVCNIWLRNSILFCVTFLLLMLFKATGGLYFVGGTHQPGGLSVVVG